MRGGVELFRDSSEMELSLCDVILGTDFPRARVFIPGADESFYCMHTTC